MKEEKIIIDIDENGKILAKTEGMTGEMCMDELNNLMKDIADLGNASVKKTDDFYQGRKSVTKEQVKAKK